MATLKIVDDPDLHPEKWPLEDFTDLRGSAAYPDRGREIIGGLVRAGEVLLVGSSSKNGKTWMVGGLIWAAISESNWMGRPVSQGKVLLIDTELKRREIDWRHTMIAREMQIEPERDQLVAWCRRGKPCDINAVDFQIRQAQLNWSEFSLIVIDSLYKCIPDGASENDNSAMGQMMNVLQGIAEFTDVPVVGVHHSTKGQQGDKAVLDVFAGAGAFGRSLDSAVVIRDHEQPDMSVVEFMTRTFPPQPAISAKFEWPLWTSINQPPEVKKTTRRPAEDQAKLDQEAQAELLKAIPEKPRRIQQAKLFDKFPHGVSKMKRLIGGLVHAKKVKIIRKTAKAKECVYYTRLPSSSESASECSSE